MSEEVLKALMQLFAIIGNQDSGSGDIHRLYIESFLRSQISKDRIGEFLAYYQDFIKPKEQGEETVKRTSMKDSVRTLSICKKINKTLNQKQKIIVFLRLLEFIRQDMENSTARNEIVKTVADVFNIAKEVHQRINLLLNNDNSQLDRQFLVIGENTEGINEARRLDISGFPGKCTFLYDKEFNIVFFVYIGTVELHLNGLAVKPYQVNVFSPGSSVRHSRGTVFYSDVISKFLDETFENTVHVYADIREHRHPNGKTALHPLKISERSGTLFGIMGASGSGKTTLLNVLSGNDRLSSGTIRVNGHDIYSRSGKITGVFGFVPQDDLLVEELTVYQNLYLSAQLCFRGIGEKELNIKVAKLLKSLGLYEVRDIRVGNPLNKKISGGQRKRLNIALELVREPQVLFLDEPTSGLSSKDSENVMDLLKELSHKGKLIFVVIHQPSSDIFKLFDKLLFLDTGGYPVYYGNPVESVIYFKRLTNQINSDIAECHSCGSVNPELIFNLIEAKEIDEYGNYTQHRKVSPEGWNALFRKDTNESAQEAADEKTALKTTDIPGKLKQWWIFLKRDFLAKIANRQYLLINLFEVPALAFVLSLLIRYINRPNGLSTYSYYQNENIPAFFFMSVVVALLVGLTVSAEEIFRDLKILKREKFLRLSRLSYLLSKVLILFTLSALQAVMLCLVGYFILKIPGNLPVFMLTIFSVFCAANLMGLVLSSTFNSPVTIYIIIPLVIIPQMLLGGAMFKFSRLNELLGGSASKVPPVSNLMVSRWAYEGMLVSQFQNNAYEKSMFVIDKVESQLNYHVSYVIPKLEEMTEVLRKDTTMSAKQHKMLAALIDQVKKKEYATLAEKFDFKPEPGTADSINAMKNFLSVKYAFILTKKQEENERLRQKNITQEMYSNKNMEEILTNALEKRKILVDTAGLCFSQVIDPVFQDPEKKGNKLGLSSHFFSPYKECLGYRMPTPYYNLAVVWLLNLFAFLLLYSDLLKKIFRLFGRVSVKTGFFLQSLKNN